MSLADCFEFVSIGEDKYRVHVSDWPKFVFECSRTQTLFKHIRFSQSGVLGYIPTNEAIEFFEDFGLDNKNAIVNELRFGAFIMTRAQALKFKLAFL